MTQRTWKDGDEVTYVAGTKRKITPGLYFYSGFGVGDVYLPGGEIRSCSSDEAYAACEKAGVEYRFVDSFDGYRGIALGDR